VTLVSDVGRSVLHSLKSEAEESIAPSKRKSISDSYIAVSPAPKPQAAKYSSTGYPINTFP